MVGWLLEKSHGHPPHSSFHSHAWVARKKALRGFRWAWKSKTKEWAELVLFEGDKVKDLFQAFPLYLQMAIFSLCFLPLCIAVSVTPRSWGWGRQHILFFGGDTIQSTTEHLALCQLRGWLQAHGRVVGMHKGPTCALQNSLWVQMLLLTGLGFIP